MSDNNNTMSKQANGVGALKQHLSNKNLNKTTICVENVSRVESSIQLKRSAQIVIDTPDVRNFDITKKSTLKLVNPNLERDDSNRFNSQLDHTVTINNERVASPSNLEIDYENEEEEEEYRYYEHDEEFESSGQAAKLANLSRQSMVPIHELIAYYQYIQQGNEYQPKNVNNKDDDQSSSSQQTVSRKPSSDTRVSNSDTPEVVENISDELFRAEMMKCEKSPSSSLQEDQTNVDVVDEGCENSPEEQNNQDCLRRQKDKHRIRANVILELINSERDFVKHLRDVVEGYLSPARRHPEIFTGERINTIFSNIEQLYGFQRKFLESLEECINWDDLASSEVGRCFLKYESGFSVYHYYCNNHPNAISELQDLYTKPRFVKFFEACRLSQNMIDISLDGFLLTPIQKICKYPLQLNELLRNTDEDHPDHQSVSDALESMRNCANLANERKRRIEALADIMSFQEKVENWFGPKLCDTSSILIHSGEVSKMTAPTYSQGIQLHLFDHLLLYSKKDLLKRNSLILKGRISMDSVTEISDDDDKPRKGFKLYCGKQQFIFIARSEKEKDEWIRAFERERNIVESDENEGFQITDKEISVARRTLQNRKHSRSARYRYKRPDTAVADQFDIDDANTIMNRTLSLPSCIHPSHVMNFVEDSKIVSTRKKNISPNASSRSPIATSQHPEECSPNQTGVGWFRKMGSKKLAKSQVYNVNGPTGNTNKQHSLSPAPPVPTNSSASILGIDLVNDKYDQLAKRHRDHMVSEEQARLFRLNNDFPSIFSAGIEKSTVKHSARPEQKSPSPNQSIDRQKLKDLHSVDGQPIGLRIQPLDTDLPTPRPLSEHLIVSSSNNTVSPSPSGSRSDTYETTVVLSTGRVVRVREDAV